MDPGANPGASTISHFLIIKGVNGRYGRNGSIEDRRIRGLEDLRKRIRRLESMV